MSVVNPVSVDINTNGLTGLIGARSDITATINTLSAATTAIDTYLATAATASAAQVAAEVIAIDQRQKLIIQMLATIVNRLLT